MNNSPTQSGPSQNSTTEYSFDGGIQHCSQSMVMLIGC